MNKAERKLVIDHSTWGPRARAEFSTVQVLPFWPHYSLLSLKTQDAQYNHWETNLRRCPVHVSCSAPVLWLHPPFDNQVWSLPDHPVRVSVNKSKPVWMPIFLTIVHCCHEWSGSTYLMFVYWKLTPHPPFPTNAYLSGWCGPGGPWPGSCCLLGSPPIPCLLWAGYENGTLLTVLLGQCLGWNPTVCLARMCD